jgi:hypothetical protein
MSLEYFRIRFPAEAESLGKAVSRIQKPDQSKITALAGALVYESSSGLGVIFRKLSKDGVAVEPDEIMLAQLSPDDRIDATENLAGVVLGVTISSLERSLVLRALDLRTFIDEYNHAITGTLLHPIKLAAEPLQPIAEDQYTKMLTLVNRDKTFSGFFENEAGLNTMPQPLSDFIFNRGVLPIIQLRILPFYRQRAGLLVPQPN